MFIMASLECQGFLFYSNFDSGNLSKVECVPRNESVVVPVNKNGKEVPEIPDIEFNVWTKPDCMGTEFENGNRTWFHFGVKGYLPSVLMKLNLVDLNRQAKMYSQGMAPVYRLVPGKPNWERIRDRPTYTVTNNVFTLSFKFKTPENIDSIMFFAFTYPYTYTELQTHLMNVDQRFLSRGGTPVCDDIYYERELLCKSLENRRVDLITISSYYNISTDRETRLQFLFPEEKKPRPFKFTNKKVIFISARVHPGETPSSFVFNGLLNFLLNREDPIAITLRRLYVFKMIPFLNPDGVVKGHYRTDTRGVNLNRMYLCPTLAEHPSVFAARNLIQYYHTGKDIGAEIESFSNEAMFTRDNNSMTQQVEVLSLEERNDSMKSNHELKQNCEECDKPLTEEEQNVIRQKNSLNSFCSICMENNIDSGLFMYLDMHGHASKKGIFMYGNHFENVDQNIECMLLPKIMSLNNYNFHFTACNFTERNMYLRDRRDGMSREGSGRVAVLKLTGLVRSYTLECNYNSGRMVNVLPPSVKEPTKNMHTLPLPPKYTPQVFEEVGRSIGASILDLTGNNPNSRIPNSEFHNLQGLRDWLRINCLHDTGGFNRISIRTNKLQAAQNQNATKPLRCRSMKNLGIKTRPNTSKLTKKPINKSAGYPLDRKENLAFRSKEQITASNSSLSLRAKRDSKPNCSKQELSNCSKQELSNRSDRSVQTSNTSIDSLKLVKSESTSRISHPINKNSKRIKVTPEVGSDRLKLREICFIKENMTKKIIAKFSSTDSNNEETYDDNDDLVVAWDPTYSPKILSRHSNRPTSSRVSTPGSPISAIRPRPGSGRPGNTSSRPVSVTNRPGSAMNRPGSAGLRAGSNVRPGSTNKERKPVSNRNTSSGLFESSTSNPNLKSNFKNSSFRVKPKKIKCSLRRLNVSNIESSGKIDKMKKRKKIIKKLL